jgi:hypothetical protein
MYCENAYLSISLEGDDGVTLEAVEVYDGDILKTSAVSTNHDDALACVIYGSSDVGYILKVNYLGKGIVKLVIKEKACIK